MSERAPARERTHWTTRVGVAGVILCVLVVASLNVTGWLTTLPGPPGIAAALVAVGLELIAFVAWEHICKYAKGRDFGRLPLAALGLALAAVVNIEGGHRGIEHIAAPLYAEADAGRRERQADLDAARAKLETQIAELQGRVDAVAATNPGMTYPGRMNAWRENYEAVTAEDRRQIAALRGAQNDLPLTAVYARPFPAWGPYALTAAFAFLSLFGLTMFGIKVADATSPAPASGAMAPATEDEALSAAPDAPRVKERSRQPTPEQAEDLAYLRGIDPKLASAWRLIRVEKRTPKGAAKELSAKSKTNVAAAVIARRLNAAEKALAERRNTPPVKLATFEGRAA